MKIYHVSQSEFEKIEGIRRIIIHDYAHQFAILDLDKFLGSYGISWRSSSIIQPILEISQDKNTLWIGVDQRLVAINLQDGHICLSLSLHENLYKIIPLVNRTIIVAELEIMLFNNYDLSLEYLESLPEIVSDVSVSSSELIIELINQRCLVFDLETYQMKDLSIKSLI